MALASGNEGHIIHAAAGTYNEGEAWAGNSSNRVVVAEGVGLVADDWPLQETVIQGASATAEGEADKYGNGTNAVRCAYVLDGGYVRGFKLTGGRTQRGNSSGVQRSGVGYPLLFFMIRFLVQVTISATEPWSIPTRKGRATVVALF